MPRAIVTGGNQGMGLTTAAALAAAGYHVTITVRSDAKGQAAVAKIKQSLQRHERRRHIFVEAEAEHGWRARDDLGELLVGQQGLITQLVLKSA